VRADLVLQIQPSRQAVDVFGEAASQFKLKTLIWAALLIRIKYPSFRP